MERGDNEETIYSQLESRFKTEHSEALRRAELEIWRFDQENFRPLSSKKCEQELIAARSKVVKKFYFEIQKFSNYLQRDYKYELNRSREKVYPRIWMINRSFRDNSPWLP
jgi:hypothetical protein